MPAKRTCDMASRETGRSTQQNSAVGRDGCGRRLRGMIKSSHTLQMEPAMSSQLLHALPPDILEFFAQKGLDLGGAPPPQVGNANGAKVRRITQLALELSARRLEELSILDLGCGEGVYAIEAALHGASVLAVNGRTERMSRGEAIARRLGLTNLRFEQADVRNISVDSHGGFDIVYFLGILYHLNVPDVFYVLANLHGLCRRWLLIDTHISLNPQDDSSFQGREYTGTRVREHGDSNPEAARRGRVASSLDNTFSFYFDKPSLIRLLVDTGFTTVVECHAPLEHIKPPDRITLAAAKSPGVIVSTYPWVNAKTEDEIASYLRVDEARAKPAQPTSLRARLNQMLRPPRIRSAAYRIVDSSPVALHYCHDSIQP